MVQSARVQQIVKGDDVILTHQIMGAIAYNAELSRAPIMVNSGDSVTCFYPLEDPTQTDLIGYAGSPVGSLSSSIVTVTIPGLIAATDTVPSRGTQSFQSGLGRTVRIEIVRYITNHKETYYLINEVDIFERGFPNSLTDTSGGINPPIPPLNLT